MALDRLARPLGRTSSQGVKDLLVLVDTEEHAGRKFLVVESDVPGREQHGLEKVEQLHH